MEFSKKPIIIAEAGKNFIYSVDTTTEKCLNEAKRLVWAADEAGADYIKWQTHVLEDEKLKRDASRYTWIGLNEELTPLETFWLPLFDYCKKIGIGFMTTPMSKMAAEKINSLVEIWKVGSADLVDRDLLEYLVSTKKQIILSTGMSTLTEIDLAVQFLKDNKADFILMHCVSLYPCDVEKINLNSIDFLRKRYDVPVGFSDHTFGPEMPSFAVKHDVVAIEKHLTLWKEAYGPDHKISLLPDEFKEMVNLVRLARIEKYSDGVEDKILYQEEKNYWPIFRTRK